MKKYTLAVFALTLAVSMPALALEVDAASPDPFAQQVENPTHPAPAPQKKSKLTLDNAAKAGIGVGAVGAYATRQKQIFEDTFFKMPLDQAGKEQRILDATDELLKKADISDIKGDGLIDKARIQGRLLNRPLVTLRLEDAQGAEAARATKLAAGDLAVQKEKRSIASFITNFFSRNSAASAAEKTKDVLEKGGLDHMKAEFAGLKVTKKLVTNAAVESAGKAAARKLFLGVGIGSTIYELGKTGLGVLVLKVAANDLAECNGASGSVVCENDGGKIRVHERNDDDEDLGRSPAVVRSGR